MIDTIFLAKVMGIFALVEGFSMILRRRMLLTVFHEMARIRAIHYIIGVVTTILGLLVIVGHNIFADTLSTMVTLVGWFMFFEGASFLFVSQTIVGRMVRMIDRPFWYYIIGVGYLILGAYFVFSVF